MGGICAVLGEAGDPGLGERLDRMLARSPYRGRPQRIVEGPLAIGIQTLGWDASLASAGNWIVALHGYIGNWDELAAERSWRFREGASEAEKLAVAYEDLGDRLFAKLDGEWTVVIWDRRRRRLVAARDVTGCRPLLCAEHGGVLHLAAEPRQIAAGRGCPLEPDVVALAGLAAGVVPGGRGSFFAGVDRVLPGHRTEIVHGSRRCAPYWEPPEERSEREVPFQLAAEMLRDTVVRAVERAADVPRAVVGLSAGIDSSTVWAVLVRSHRASGRPALAPEAVTLTYPGLSCDEEAAVRATHRELGTSGRFVPARHCTPLWGLDELLRRIDHPFPEMHASLLPVGENAAQNGPGTYFLGDGPDEFLAGHWSYLADLLARGRFISFAADLATLRTQFFSKRRILVWSARRAAGRVLGWRRRGAPPLVAERLRREVAARSLEAGGDGGRDPVYRRELLGRLRFYRGGWGLDTSEQLLASFGLEVRRPLATREVVELAFALPARWWLAGVRAKHLLRAAVRGLVPDHVVAAERKITFEEIAAEGAGRVAASVRRWRLVRDAVLDGEALDRIAARSKNGDLRGGTRLIALYALERWYRARLEEVGDEGAEDAA